MAGALQVDSRFATCDDLLAAVRHTAFARVGSDVPIRAEYTSRKTGGGNKITVRCKLGVRKPGRKKAGERVREEDERCQFRVVACRQVVSTSPRSSAFVVTEISTHTASVHTNDPQTDAGDLYEPGSGASKLGTPRQNSTGRFSAGHPPPPPSPDSPFFLPEAPTVVNSRLVTTSGFSIPLLPVRPDYHNGGERIRPKKRPRADCEHRGDSKWRMWEQRLQTGTVTPTVKRPRLRGTAGEDALRAWGWVANLVAEEEEPEPEEEVPSAGMVDGVPESTPPSRLDQARAAPSLGQAASPRPDTALSEIGGGGQGAAHPELRHLVAFLTRPTVIRIEPAPVVWGKWLPLPITPFTPPPLPATEPGAGQRRELRSPSPTPSESASTSSAAREIRHETPETSFSPVSPTLFRPKAPFWRAIAQVDEPEALPTGQVPGNPGEGLQQRESRDRDREQTALEALLDLQQLRFQPKPEPHHSEDAASSPPEAQRPSRPPTDSQSVASANVRQGPSEQLEPTWPRRVPRKRSRWERPASPDEEASKEPTTSSVHPEGETDRSADLAPAPAGSAGATTDETAASPYKPAALAFVPRASKKLSAARGSLGTSKPIASPGTGAPSMAGPSAAGARGVRPGVGTSRARVSSSVAQMAVAYASRHKREADLREEMRNSSVAPENVEEEPEADTKAKKAAEAEALKHSLWKLGGWHEGGKTDRLYSAHDLRNKLAHVERNVPDLRPPEMLSEPNAEVYISLLEGPNRPARHRLPSLPTFPSRAASSLTTPDQASRQGPSAVRAEAGPQPDKRQLLALEYLYGRAVGVDECAYLAEKEPAMWQLVKVAAAVAEVNEWMRRVARDHNGASPRTPTVRHQAGAGSGAGSRGWPATSSPRAWTSYDWK
ncbi:hypothetical protein JCM3774_005565 [Rhodotorula dairenensis]